VESETDTRASYCAAAISKMIRATLPKEEQDIDYGFDKEKLVHFLMTECLGYAGGFTFAGN